MSAPIPYDDERIISCLKGATKARLRVDTVTRTKDGESSALSVDNTTPGILGAWILPEDQEDDQNLRAFIVPPPRNQDVVALLVTLLTALTHVYPVEGALVMIDEALGLLVQRLVDAGLVQLPPEDWSL